MQKILTGLYSYPVKGCRGIHHNQVFIGPMGPGFDRRWMIIDENGRFISQRQFPQMALIETAIENDLLIVRIPHFPEYRVSSGGTKKEVTIWNDTCIAVDQGNEIAQILSVFLKKECRLVFMPDTTHRQVKAVYAISPEDIVGFADGYPFLLISEASLEDLNSRLQESVPMDRFRPNLVISGCYPYEEDTWKWIRIRGITFKVAKSCSRCTVINVDQATGEKGTEPLKTLATYRKEDSGKIMFGRHLIHAGQGDLFKGDIVEVLE